MSGHTPGPWEASYLDKHGQRIVENRNIEICTCWHHSVGAIEKEMEANARLIAAAPDLLEALDDIMREYRHIMGDDTAEITAAFAAIAKARGNDT